MSQHFGKNTGNFIFNQARSMRSQVQLPVAIAVDFNYKPAKDYWLRWLGFFVCHNDLWT